VSGDRYESTLKCYHTLSHLSPMVPSWLVWRLSRGGGAPHLCCHQCLLDAVAVKASILDRLVTQLRRNGMSVAAASATARKRLQQAGILKKGSEDLTEYGKKRQAMGAAGRAKDRAAKKAAGKLVSISTMQKQTGLP